MPGLLKVQQFLQHAFLVNGYKTSNSNLKYAEILVENHQNNDMYRPFSGYKNRCLADFLVYYW